MKQRKDNGTQIYTDITDKKNGLAIPINRY